MILDFTKTLNHNHVVAMPTMKIKINIKYINLSTHQSVISKLARKMNIGLLYTLFHHL